MASQELSNCWTSSISRRWKRSSSAVPRVIHICTENTHLLDSETATLITSQKLRRANTDIYRSTGNFIFLKRLNYTSDILNNSFSESKRWMVHHEKDRTDEYFWSPPIGSLCPSQIKEWFVHVAGENKRVRPRFFIISKVLCSLGFLRLFRSPGFSNSNSLSGEIQQRDHPSILQHEHAKRRSEHLHHAILPGRQRAFLVLVLRHSLVIAFFKSVPIF